MCRRDSNMQTQGTIMIFQKIDYGMRSQLYRFVFVFVCNDSINSLYIFQEFVFCRANADINDLAVSTDRLQSIRTGDINILQYSVIKDYVLSGHIQLL